MVRTASLLLCVALVPTAPLLAQHPGHESSGLNALLREIEGGGEVRNFLQRYFLGPIPDVRVGTAASLVTTDETGVKEQTFISPPLPLRNGEVLNKWLPIDWPEGHIAVKAFTADVIKAGPNGEVPPPEPCCGGPHEAGKKEAFLHHWTVNKWQLPGNLFENIVKSGGLEYELNWQKQGLIEAAAGAGLQAGANGPCWDSNLHVFFGIGNEVRGSPPMANEIRRDAYAFPDPYGVVFDSPEMRKNGQFMVLNTHVIDLRNVTNRRACTECDCEHLGVTPKDPRTLGGLACCHSTHFDGGRCPLAAGAESSNAKYYIRYTVKWRDFDAASTKPLEVITLDSTDNNTKWGDLPFLPGGFQENHTALKADPVSMATVMDARSGDFNGHRACHVEYFVPACATPGPCIHRMHNSWELPYPVEIVFIRSHFHTGAINMTTSTSQSDICTGNGIYDDDGYLVDIPTCTFGDTAMPALVRVERGQRLFVEVAYKQDELPRYGVMAMSFIFAHVPKLGLTTLMNQTNVLV